MNGEFKVLVLEDDEIGYKLIETALRILNTKVLHAETGKDAFTLLKANDFNLILLDMNLPDMTGFEFMDHFNKLKINTPVIGHTAFSLNNEKSRCIETGCLDLLLKPININKLRKVIDRFKEA